MKKHILIVIAVLLSAFVARAEVNYTQYYSSLNGKSGAELKTAIYNLCRNKLNISGSITNTYTELSEKFRTTDKITINGKEYWWDKYSSELFLLTKSFSSCSYQREHSMPKSWWKLNDSYVYTTAYCDLNHLYPSNGPANQAKSNWPLGIVKQASFDNGVSKVGTPANGASGGAEKVFEPADEYKGDFARAYMYMVTAYQDLKWNVDEYPWMVERNTYPTFTDWAVTLIGDWHHADRVSTNETDRNDAVQSVQGNRNPFIDLANLYDYVWGDSVGVPLNVATTVKGTSVQFIPTPDPVDGTVFARVTDTSVLTDGAMIIIVAKDYNKALSITQNNNNRSAANIVRKADGTIIVPSNSDVEIITLEAVNGSSNTYNLLTSSGYLAAASSSNNKLRTEETLDANGNSNALISINADGATSVVFQGDHSRNVMQYNHNASDATACLFNCYASASQGAVEIYMAVPEPVTTLFTRVTDVSALADGSKVIVVAKDYDKALGINQNNNNRASADIVRKSDGTIAVADNSGVAFITLKAVTGKSNTYNMLTSGGYLYAASSGSNYLRSEDAPDANGNGNALISISADGTSIVFQGSNSRNVMQYNHNTTDASASIFSCYSSASQCPIELYVAEPEPVYTTFTRVTKASSLGNGAQVIIVAKDHDKALGTTQNNNNRASVDIVRRANGTIAVADNSGVAVITLEAVNGMSNTYNLLTSTGYLYSPSSSANNLKTEATVDKNGNANALITISADGTSILFQGSATRNVMQYNHNTTDAAASIFSCYASASQGAVEIYMSKSSSVTPNPDPEPEPDPTPAGKLFSRVTKTSSLAAGKKVIIVAKDYDYALGNNQKSTNRAAAAVTRANDGTITVDTDSEVEIITLEVVRNKSNTYNLRTPSGYLYAPSSSANNLKTEDAPDAKGNADALFSISADGASIIFQGTSSRNVMQYYNSADAASCLFNCYGSASQGALEVYMCDDVDEPEPEPDPINGAVFTRVTNKSSLRDGAQVIIVATAYDKAMSLTQNSKNRSAIDIVRNIGDDTIIVDDNCEVEVVTLEAVSGKSNTYRLLTSSGYLYAPSSSANNLKTEDAPDKNSNAEALITVTSSGTSIIFQGTSTHNEIRYYATGKCELFSCYGSSTQNAVELYVHTSGTVAPRPEHFLDPNPEVECVYYSSTFTDGETGNCSAMNMGDYAFNVWTSDRTYGWKASGYNAGSAHATDALLLTPEINIASALDATFTFSHCINYADASNMSVYVRTSDEVDHEITSQIAWPTTRSWEYIGSGEVDLSDYLGDIIRLVFRYRSSDSEAGTWEIKDLTVTGSQRSNNATSDVPLLPEIDNSIYPVEYYNIEGRRVDPEYYRGIVIRRQGTDVTKILLR